MYAAKSWDSDAFLTFSNEFVEFHYPPDEWVVKNRGQNVRLETRMGINAEISVELLPQIMSPKEYCDVRRFAWHLN